MQRKQSRRRHAAYRRNDPPWNYRPAPPVIVSLGLTVAVPLAVFLALQPEFAPAFGALVAGFAAGRLSD